MRDKRRLAKVFAPCVTQCDIAPVFDGVVATEPELRRRALENIIAWTASSARAQPFSITVPAALPRVINFRFLYSCQQFSCGVILRDIDNCLLRVVWDATAGGSMAA